MEDRLSTVSVKGRLHSGHSSLPWDPGQPSGFLAGIDFEQVLAHPEVKTIIQSMPVQPLYYGIKKVGLAEAVDILPYLTSDQVLRMFDYDCWIAGELNLKKSLPWINAFGSLGKEQLYKRFSDLDEEYQLALLQGRLRIYGQEDMEKMSDSDQDALYKMPCNLIFYHILSEDEDESTAIYNIIEAALQENISYAYALINYASFVPPNESAQTLKQFRNARLEEDGFVHYEEAYTLFSGIDHAEVFSRWADARAETTSGAVIESEDMLNNFFDKALSLAQVKEWSIDEIYTFHQSLLYLSNSLMSLVHLDPDDMFGLNRILSQAKAMVSLGLDYLAGGDLEVALLVLKEEHPKTLFKVGLSLVDDIRQTTVKKILKTGINGSQEIDSAWRRRQYGEVLYIIDTKLSDSLGHDQSEILKGLFNRFPMRMSYIDESKTKLNFKLIESMVGLKMLMSAVNGLFGILHLLKGAGAFPLQASLEKSIVTASVHALIGKGFAIRPISEEDLKTFNDLGSHEIKERLQGLSYDAKGQLDKDKKDWLMDGYEVSSEGAVFESTRILEEIFMGVELASSESIKKFQDQFLL